MRGDFDEDEIDDDEPWADDCDLIDDDTDEDSPAGGDDDEEEDEIGDGL